MQTSDLITIFIIRKANSQRIEYFECFQGFKFVPGPLEKNPSIFEI